MSDISKPAIAVTALTSEYTRLIQKVQSNSALALQSSHAGRLAAIHSKRADLEIWRNIIQETPEVELFNYCCWGFSRSLYEGTTGGYRQAIFELRQFLEASIGVIYFSMHDYHFRAWKAGKYDLQWSEVTNKDNGVFSASYCKLYCAGLETDSSIYSEHCAKVYRSCSEYVHGNYSRTDFLKADIEYNEPVFREWLTLADSVFFIVQIGLFSRYLAGLNAEDKALLEPVFQDNVSSIPIFRQYYSKG